MFYTFWCLAFQECHALHCPLQRAAFPALLTLVLQHDQNPCLTPFPSEWRTKRTLELDQVCCKAQWLLSEQVLSPDGEKANTKLESAELLHQFYPLFAHQNNLHVLHLPPSAFSTLSSTRTHNSKENNQEYSLSESPLENLAISSTSVKLSSD